MRRGEQKGPTGRGTQRGPGLTTKAITTTGEKSNSDLRVRYFLVLTTVADSLIVNYMGGIINFNYMGWVGWWCTGGGDVVGFWFWWDGGGRGANWVHHRDLMVVHSVPFIGFVPLANASLIISLKFYFWSNDTIAMSCSIHLCSWTRTIRLAVAA